MIKVRYVFMVLGMLYSVPSSAVQVSVGVGLPNASIGVNFSSYPDLAIVPGYPVYYAPALDANLFFYDGYYWVFQDDYWYMSSWYNGPWTQVDPEDVPLYVLRVPVRYYRQPPSFFMGWQSNASPRWGDHWGRDWQQRRSGWDQWDHRAAPQPAPLPAYQRQYSGERYPRQIEQQRTLQQKQYPYQPHDEVKRHEQGQGTPVTRPQQTRPDAREQRPQPITGIENRDKPVQKIPALQMPQQQAPIQQPTPKQERSLAPAERSARPQESVVTPRPQPSQRAPDIQKSPPATPQPPQPDVQNRGQQPHPSQQQESRQQGRDAPHEARPADDRGRDRKD